MKISEALRQVGDTEVDFGGGNLLKVTYRPSSMSIADIEEMRKNRDIKRVIRQVREQVVQWDLEDEGKNIIPLAEPERGAPDPLEQIPLHILVTTLIGIQKAQRPDPEA